MFEFFTPQNLIKCALAVAVLPVIGLASTAQAGEWQLNAAACPDLREDRIDARTVTGRRDLREDRADMRVISCPASAWTYHLAPGERMPAKLKAAHPASLYVNTYGHVYQAPVVTVVKTTAPRRTVKHRRTAPAASPALVRVVIR